MNKEKVTCLINPRRLRPLVSENVYRTLFNSVSYILGGAKARFHLDCYCHITLYNHGLTCKKALVRSLLVAKKF